MPRTILHVDMDAFYASVEKRRNKSLRNLPVIVGADPRDGGGRGVVVSCSYEARRMGVHSGQPISAAYRRCPQAVYLRPNFELYESVSQRVMEVLRKQADKFEQMSVDEAFLDVSGRVKDYGEAREIALEIKREIREREGLTCSIGIAPNKSAAKMASGRQKPDGLTVVEPLQLKAFLDPLPVREIAGVGGKTQAALAGLGIETVGQLARYPVNKLVWLFGKGGVWLWQVANGLEDAEVEELGTPKSISLEHTFEEDVSDWVVVLRELERLAAELHERLLDEKLLFRTVGIKVRFHDFQTFARQKSCPDHTAREEVLLTYAESLFKEFIEDERRIRLIGVRASNLKEGAADQKTLSAWV